MASSRSSSSEDSRRLPGVPPKKKPALPVTGNPDADDLLVTDPLALLTGMLLDQQIH